MPGLVSGEYPNRNIYYSSYLSTYIERDVRDISGTVDALKFNRFIAAVVARTSQLLNYNPLPMMRTLICLCKAWVNILETLGIIFLLHPYSNNVLKCTIKTLVVNRISTSTTIAMLRKLTSLWRATENFVRWKLRKPPHRINDLLELLVSLINLRCSSALRHPLHGRTTQRI